jgi:hypothetical protein
MGNNFVSGHGYITWGSSNEWVPIYFSYNQAANIFCYSVSGFGLAIASSNANAAGTPANANFSIGCDIVVPIAQWSSNVTMADRQVEEYAWNSDTTDTSTTASGFSNGPSGVFIGSYTTAERLKRVRFTSPILPTDLIILEINDGNGWINGAQVFTYITQSASRYGILIIQVNSTDVDVKFQASGSRPTNATYAGAGETWSSWTTYKWRVRKVSGGASVGYPVSARNIVGDTSGTAVPSGAVGETYRQSVSGNAPNLTTINLTTINLPAGVWFVSFTGKFDVQNAVAHENFASLSLVSATLDGNYQISLQGNNTTLNKSMSLTRVVSTTGQNFYLTWLQNGAATTPISGYITYTRIA